MKRLLAALVIAAGLTPTAIAPVFAAGFDCGKWQKNADGSWSAKEPVEIGGPAGRLDYVPDHEYKEGQSMNGLDIAKLLNANCTKK